MAIPSTRICCETASFVNDDHYCKCGIAPFDRKQQSGLLLIRWKNSFLLPLSSISAYDIFANLVIKSHSACARSASQPQ